ncbi:pfkB family carbohydrate kinase domain-containing protein [Hirsutella rhossiliensis]|uniref:PfkB family carbohydrate kinase domain-containing protein n=1 Tax=Hirsutella rhossiliensis TaxID=111463 RepID=A0A9P8SK67_9HYPO|nr:pfkB family carbohydrate kinase domain-containing protein [Hirsutella rhossiliensis]KAH0964445.1 pfkB family carbohydrate kinase domain-containing protein [Hirsutella rhossiliensis]
MPLAMEAFHTDKDPKSGDGDDPATVNHSTTDFVTLGMLILDDIDFGPSMPPARSILGGAGAYSAIGARILSPPPLSSSIGWVVDQGSDFPQALASIIDSWSTAALIRRDPRRLTTRGWNGYQGPAEKRAFEYLTPKKRITADDLTTDMLLSRAITRPGTAYVKPVFVWEPVPDLCVPDELLNCTNTLPLIDICSPNHTELAGFMGNDGIDPETGLVSTSSVERACEQLLASMPLRSYALVVRAGEKGCFVAKNGGQQSERTTQPCRACPRGSLQHDTDIEALFAGLRTDEDGLIQRDEIEVDPGTEYWIPAYHQDPGKVVDPTGGGNAFLGGLAVALARGHSLEDAVAMGSVAASFAIEQVGMPLMAINEDGAETWNGALVCRRLREFQLQL